MSTRTLRLHFLAVLTVILMITLWARQDKWPSPDVFRIHCAPSIPSELEVAKPTPPEQIGNNSPIFNDVPTAYRQHEEPPRFCDDRFGLSFLESLRRSATSYCASGSQAGATCFHIATAGHRTDSLCVAGPVSYDGLKGKYILPCTEAYGKKFRSLGTYWYGTGPGPIFREFVDLVEPSSTQAAKANPELMLLIKREGPYNLWHSLMEIFAATLTVDTINMVGKLTASPPIPAAAAEIGFPWLRIVILDSHEEGPFWDLWSHFSPLPLTRFRDMDPVMAEGGHIIVPLAGGANPFWQGDWKVLTCRESVLLDVFVRRVLERYDLPMRRPPEAGSPVRLMFVDRRETRQLLDQGAHLDAIRSRFPNVLVEVVDLAGMTFVEQVQKASETDVLVGVHGAGLTHAMFMDRESALVEIMPGRVEHKGFRNLAKLRGIRYFGAHADLLGEEDWHEANVGLKIDSFLNVVGAAVASVSNSGLRNNDIL